MSREVYEKTLAAAVEDLKRLQAQQSDIDKKIASTKQMIVSLRTLLGKRAEVEAGLGLKEACLQVLRASSNPLQLGQVGRELERIGYSLRGYSNPMSAIRNTLSRMVGKEIEVHAVKGKKLYSAGLDDKWKF
jgi:hypothetical protein